MPTPDEVRTTQIIVRSYLWLRVSIGFVALLLPVLVLAVFTYSDRALLPSISDSYHHPVTNSVFIGSMVAFATFLWAYQVPRENALANTGAAFATLIAVAPNLPRSPSGAEWPRSVCLGIPLRGSGCWQAVGNVVHLGSALAFFFILGLFCVRKWARDPDDDARAYYRFSGVGIWVALLAAIVSGRLDVTGLFILCEIVMVELFGLSWLIRGGIRPQRALWALAGASVPALALWAGFVSGVLPGAGYTATITSVVSVAVAAVALYGSLRNQTPPSGVDEARSSENRFAEWSGGTRGLGVGFAAGG